MFAGCGARTKQKLEFDPLEPLRVAVLPFYQTGSDGERIESDPNVFLIDNIPGLSKKPAQAPPELVRNFVHQELKKTIFDVAPAVYVDAQLVHNKLVKGRSFDFEKIESLDPKQLCELFSCDALIFGKITEWDRSYYGIQSISTVAIELRLVRARDAKVIYSVDYEDSESRGLSKGPTGYTSLVLEPLKGLDSEIIEGLAEKVVRSALTPLFIKSRPQFLETPAPFIVSSAHNSRSGRLARGRPLVVLMYGSPGHTGTFSVGDEIENVLMVERFKGHYYGEFYGLKEDFFENQVVSVSLTDEFGRTINQLINSRPVSLR
jgi:hypothetical protein